MSQRRDLQFEMAENVTCRVRIERGSISGLPSFLADFEDVDDVVVIFDPAVEDRAQQLATDLDAACCLPVIGGEAGKTLESVQALASQMLSFGVGRRAILISVGGGVVTDVGGFLAGIYMRGIRCVHVPTTLLGMCDAALGGKCGVDLGGSKNMLGVIRQPSAVVVDPDVLSTLSDTAFKDGVVEVVKKAFVLNAHIVSELEESMTALLQRDTDVVDRCVKAAITMKMSVVASDEKEGGRRMLLNYGHTVGHAIETITDFSVSHGEAVALGMVEETRLLAPDVAPLVESLLNQMGLRTDLEPDWTRKSLWTEMQRDKKVADRRVRIAVPEKVGVGVIRELTEERFLNHGV